MARPVFSITHDNTYERIMGSTVPHNTPQHGIVSVLTDQELHLLLG